MTDRYTYDDMVKALQLGHREGYANAAADVQSGELTSDGHYDDRLAEADCPTVCQEWLEEAGLLRDVEGAATSVHGPCNDGGRPVRSSLPDGLPDDLRAWCEARLDAGEAKYGAPLRVGWSRAREALLEELADAVCYAVALEDDALAAQLAGILSTTVERDDHNQPPSRHVTAGGGMQPHQQRVATEAAVLGVKLTALLDFIATSPIYQSLPIAEQSRLQRQSRHMAAYYDVLMERIDAFGA